MWKETVTRSSGYYKSSKAKPGTHNLSGCIRSLIRHGSAKRMLKSDCSCHPNLPRQTVCDRLRLAFGRRKEEVRYVSRHRLQNAANLLG